MSIEERLRKLELELSHANRRIRWMSVCLMLATAGILIPWTGGGVGTTAQAQGQPQRVIRANAFVLEDENGKERAALLTHSTGAMLSLHDHTGNINVMLGAGADGTALSLEHATGAVVLGAGTESGGPNVVLKDKNGRRRADLGLNSLDSDNPSLRLYDTTTSSRPVVALGVMADTTGLIVLGDNVDTHRIALLVTETDGPTLSLSDEAGNPRTALNVSQNGPALRLYDAKGQGRATLGTTRMGTPDGRTTTYPESSLLLFGPDRKMVWQAP